MASNHEHIKDMVEDVVGRIGGIDILVNVAGIAIFGTIENLEMSDWKRVIEVNLFGALKKSQNF